ncbi:hypothetical protein BRADI_4g40067v3 [Brachypodium distachyon]|uniref:Uncharacterized protein n=1 Tax=Brachypodium distachyon TaxID=15368 RepID=A0A2K2CTE8_BRADI|nr:hypothetical protein BRADI_4g40067v3 [Brachypodium distachyon]
MRSHDQIAPGRCDHLGSHESLHKRETENSNGTVQPYIDRSRDNVIRAVANGGRGGAARNRSTEAARNLARTRRLERLARARLNQARARADILEGGRNNQELSVLASELQRRWMDCSFYAGRPHVFH